MTRFRLIGISDDVTKCDCCGRQNLKKTIVLSDSLDLFPGSDEIFYYGQDCAQTALKFSKYYTKKQMIQKALDAGQTVKIAQCRQLLVDREVIVTQGRFCLPCETCLEPEIQRSNVIKKYPCFADSSDI
jgi:hypothetical protein